MNAEYIRDFIRELRFPDEAVEYLAGVVETVNENTPLDAVMGALRDVYLATPDRLNPFIARLNMDAQENGIHRFTLHLLFLLSCTDELRQSYARAGIPDEIYFKSMDDFRCKIMECKACHDVWGTATADWYSGFFTMDRFGLGRMQYNHTEFQGEEYTFGDLTLRKGDRLLAMHIPSAGPMPFEVRLDSYKKAYAFYAGRGELKNGLLAVTCGSWLLYPAHKTFLPDTLNIVSFIVDFDILRCGEDDRFSNDWRVFGRYAALPPAQWPRDTALRKAYAEWLCSGGKAGHGYGLMLFDGERIVNAPNGRKQTG